MNWFSATTPNITVVASAKPVPVMVTEVPPPGDARHRADGGDSRGQLVEELVGGTGGAGADGVVTVMSTVPRFRPAI